MKMAETRVFVRNLDAGEAYCSQRDRRRPVPVLGAGFALARLSSPSRTISCARSTPPVVRRSPCAPPPTARAEAGAPTGSSSSLPTPGVASTGFRPPVAKPVEITTRDAEHHNSHRLPWFLPDGRHFLFVARGVNSEESAIMIGSLDGDEPRELLRSTSQAAYSVGTGCSLFATRL